MKIIRNIILILSIFVFFISSLENYLIIGAGPVGLYLAHQLLEKSHSSYVEILEGRSFSRLQCIRLPYYIASRFPQEIKQVLWPIQSIREMLFTKFSIIDKKISTYLGYQHFPRISVGNLQKTLKEYMQSKYFSRFKFIHREADITLIQEQSQSDRKIIFFTAGGGAFNDGVRKDLNILNKKFDFAKNTDILDGVYLIYRNVRDGSPLDKIDEDYIRDGQFMNRIELSRKGLTYSATNNEQRDVQLYTYPIGELKDIYNEIPASIKTSASFPKGINYKTGNTILEQPTEELTIAEKDSNKKENEWLQKLRTALDKLFAEFKIYIPSHANIHYAKRMQYAFEKTNEKNRNGVDVVFVGDAMGGTDYKYGLNLGRGLYSAYNLVEFLVNNPANVPHALEEYQKYWDTVVDTEFGDPNKDLIADPAIFYKYVIMGRTIDGKEYGPYDFQAYSVLSSKKLKKRIKRKIK